MEEAIVKMELLSELTEEMHISEEIELFYVVAGNCLIHNKSGKTQLVKDDVILLNAGMERRVTIFGENSLVCKITYSYLAVAKHLKEKFIRFMCNSTVENDIRYSELTKMIKEILQEYERNKKQEFTLKGQYLLIMGYLLEHFKLSSIQSDDINDTDSRMTLIRLYVQEHYFEEGALLSKLAEELYMSPSSLSRYFKKKTGETISSYVFRMRMKKIEELLLQNNMSITEIAIESGFGTASALNRSFKKYFGITPGDYRRENRVQELEKRKKQVDSGRLQLGEIIQKNAAYNMEQGNTEFVSVDTQKIVCQISKKIKMINIGAARVLSNPKMQKQICFFRDSLGIEYVRIWNLFSSRMVFGIPGSRKHSFFNLDCILDFCVDNHLKLFLNMGYRYDNRLINANAEENNEDDIILMSEDEWDELLDEFFAHICKRYGITTVGSWIIEYTFFMDTRPYYVSDTYSASQVWKQGYKTAKKYIPKGKVAAPGLYMEMDTELMGNIVDSFWNTGCIPDVFTSCKLTLKEEEKNEELGNVNEQKNFADQIDKVKVELEKHDFQGEYCITAWDDISIKDNNVQDSCYRGCYLVNNILDNQEKVDLLGIWYASDLANESETNDVLLNSSSGLLSKDGICKPAWYALYFIGKLGEYRIGKGVHYCVSKNRDDEFCILCHNATGLFTHHYPRDDKVLGNGTQLFRIENKLQLIMELSHFQVSGKYAVVEEFVNEQHGSILNEWGKLGFDPDLTYDEISYLRKITIPARRKSYVYVKERKLLLHMMLETNEMRFIIIRKMKGM